MMGVLLKIRLIPRKDGCFIFDGRQVKSLRKARSDGVGAALHLRRSVLDEDLGLPIDEMLIFLTWDDLKRINEALDVSDRETLKLRKGRGWKTGPRPYDKKHGLTVDENVKIHELM